MSWTSWFYALTIFCMSSTIAMSQATTNQVSFRVDTDIYVGDEKKPSIQTLTLFHEGVYYDFAMEEQGSISMIDLVRGRILLLDRRRQIRTTVKTDELLSLVARAKIEASSQPELRSVIAASEMIRINQTTGELVVGNDDIRYQATMQAPDDPRMAAQYAEFADWSARLNAVYPPYLQPFVRMSLNQELARQGMLPKEVVKIWKQQGETAQAKIRLLPNGRLSTDDHAKISQTGSLLVQYKEVPIEAYMQVAIPDTAAASGKTTMRK